MACVSRLLVVALCLLPMLAFAQTPKEAKEPAKPPASSPTPVPSTPERTTASFGDWVERCDAAPAPAKRVCEVAQAMTVQGQSAPIAQIAFGRATRAEPMRVTVVLPVAVTLTAKSKIVSEKDDKSPIELTWQRCIPGGCIASAVVADDIMARLGVRTEPGGIAFKDAAEHDIAVPLSFRASRKRSPRWPRSHERPEHPSVSRPHQRNGCDERGARVVVFLKGP